MKPELINGIFAISGAIIGALITGLFSRNIARKNNDKKEITLLSTHSSQLIEVADIVKKKAEILIDNKPVKGIYKNEFIIANSGNATLYDISVKLTLKNEDAKLLSTEFNRSNFKIDESDYEIRMDDNLVEITLSFINAMDEINFILLTDTETDIDIKFRQPEIGSLIKEGCNPETPGVLISAFYDAFESNSLFRAYFKLMVPGFHNYLKLKKEKITPYNKV